VKKHRRIPSSLGREWGDEKEAGRGVTYTPQQ